MKMAKASEADMKMALDLSQLLESLEQGYFPVEEGSDEESDPFNESRADDCKKAIELIFDVLGRGSLFRVTFGMTVLLDPRNELIDPALSHLEHHPDAKWAREQRDGLLDALQIAFCHVDSHTHCNDHAKVSAAIAKESAYGLIRYLAGGAFA